MSRSTISIIFIIEAAMDRFMDDTVFMRDS